MYHPAAPPQKTKLLPSQYYSTCLGRALAPRQLTAKPAIKVISS